MNKYQLELIWLVAQLLFIVHYTPFVVRMLIRIPDTTLPYVNSLLLIVSYSISVIQERRDGPYVNTDIASIVLFVSLPRAVFFLPFYLNSIMNVSDRLRRGAVAPRNITILRVTNVFKEHGILLSNVRCALEVACSLLSVVFLVVGMSNIITVIAYLFLIRSQYFYDPVMRGTFSRIRLYLDDMFVSVNPSLRNYYTTLRDYIISFHPINGMHDSVKTD